MKAGGGNHHLYAADSVGLENEHRAPFPAATWRNSGLSGLAPPSAACGSVRGAGTAAGERPGKHDIRAHPPAPDLAKDSRGRSGRTSASVEELVENGRGAGSSPFTSAGAGARRDDGEGMIPARASGHFSDRPPDRHADLGAIGRWDSRRGPAFDCLHSGAEGPDESNGARSTGAIASWTGSKNARQGATLLQREEKFQWTAPKRCRCRASSQLALAYPEAGFTLTSGPLSRPSVSAAQRLQGCIGMRTSRSRSAEQEVALR